MPTVSRLAERLAQLEVQRLKRQSYGFILLPTLGLGLACTALVMLPGNRALWLGLASQLLWSGLIMVSRLRQFSTQVFEWTVYMTGAAVLLALLAQPAGSNAQLVFAVCSPLLYLWAFVAWGARRGAGLAVGYALSALLVIILTGLPFAAQGRPTPEALFLLATPLYLSLLYGLTYLLEAQTAFAITVASRQAYTDSLTGLPNRLQLRETLEEKVAEAQRSGRSFALFFLDLDNFKVINDTLGHARGDDLLRQLAGRWQPLGRPGDLLARISGDEFAVLCDLEPRDNPEALAERYLSVLHEPFLLGIHSCPVTVSMGVALSAGPGLSAASMLIRADQAMYRVKNSGKGGVQVSLTGPALRTVVEGSALTEEWAAGTGNLPDARRTPASGTAAPETTWPGLFLQDGPIG